MATTRRAGLGGHRPASFAGLFAVLVLLAGAPPARATFPGHNGSLLYTDYISGAPASDPVHIWKMDPAGTPRRDLGAGLFARWSPDGSKIGLSEIAFADQSMPTADGSAVTVMAADGSNRHTIVVGKTDGPERGVVFWSWLPNGRLIYSASVPNVATRQYFVIGADGSNKAPIAAPPAGSENGDLAPDGGSVVGSAPHTLTQADCPQYPADRRFQMDLFTAAYPGGAAVDVTHTTDWDDGFAGNTTNAAFAPDGKSIVYVRVRSCAAVGTYPDRQVVVSPTAGGSADVLTTAVPSANVYTPDDYPYNAFHSIVFSPDGQSVAFINAHDDRVTFVDTATHSKRVVGLGLVSAGDVAAGLDWQPTSAEVVITNGPSGVTQANTATFEFASPGNSTSLECSLDHAAFASCTSPKLYQSLADGLHHFEVRVGSDGEPSTRDWKVDTTPPTALIDQAPSGNGNGPDATVGFHSTETGSSFRCSLDGEAFTDCSSPKRLLGLSDGPHTYDVQATDGAGNVQPNPTRVQWGVGGPGSDTGGGGGTPDVQCAKGTDSKEAFGPIVAKARTTGACFALVTYNGRKVHAAPGPVSVNGVQITPAQGTLIIADENLNDGTVTTTGPVTIGIGKVEWTVRRPLDWNVKRQARVEKLLPFAASELQDAKNPPLSIAKLPVIVSPKFELSAHDGGDAKVSVKLSLPTAFSGLPAPPDKTTGGLTTDFDFTTSNDKGPSFRFKATLKNAFLFGTLPMDDLTVAYDQETGIFDGSANLKIAKADYALSVQLGPNGFFGVLRKAEVQVSGLNKPIGEGFFLQGFGGRVEKIFPKQGDPFPELSANATVTFGPELDLKPALDFKGAIGELAGKGTLDFSDPWKLRFEGAMKLVNLEVANASVEYSSRGQVTFTGAEQLEFNGYGFSAGIQTAWFDIPTGLFDIEAFGQLKLPGIAGHLLDGRTDVVMSRTGFAACFGSEGYRIGFTKLWSQNLQPVASACDVAPFVIKRPEGVATSGRGRGRAVASAASDGFTIAKGTRLRALAFHGQNAPPKVTLHGPGGRLLTTPAGSGGVHNGLGFLFQDFARKTTYVVLIRPAAGHWSIDAPDTVTTEQADGLAPVTIRAKVSGRGSRRVLRWSTKGLRGQRLEFAERSGRAGHKLLATGRAHGSIRFRPDRRLGRRRTIEVTVLNHGLPRLTRVVARYALPRLPRLRAISGLRLRRGLLRWRGQPAAVTYALIAVTRRGDHIPATTRRARYRPPRGTLSLTIVAVDIDGRPGPRRSFKLRR